MGAAQARKYGTANFLRVDDPQYAKRSSSAEYPRVLRQSSGSLVKPGMRGSTRPRSVCLDADLDNECAYAVEPHEIVVKHLEGERLGGDFLGIDALDLPGMPELEVPRVSLDPSEATSGRSMSLVGGDLLVGTADESDVAVAVLLSIAPDSPIARFGADHPGVLTVGTVVLQATKVSETATSLTIGRWGWSIVVQQDPAVPRLRHPGARIQAHRSFSRIGYIFSRGSVQKGWNQTNPMAAVRTGDCVVAVNGVPVWQWLEHAGNPRLSASDDKLNDFLHDAGERQEWVVVRVPGSRPATGNHRIAALIQETLNSPTPSSGSDGSLRNKVFRESLSLDESDSSASARSSALSIGTDMDTDTESMGNARADLAILESAAFSVADNWI